MNKLIDIQILNNTLLLTFENGGYIKVSNLNLFTLNIAKCYKKLNYIEFFQTKFDDIDTYNDIAESMIYQLKIKESDLNKSKILEKMGQYKFDMDKFLVQYDEYDNKYNYKHKCLICSNGKAILLKLTDIAFFEYRTPFEILQNEVKILKENFEVCNVNENFEVFDFKLDHEHDNSIEFALKNVFIDYRDIYERQQVEKQKQKLKSQENQKFSYISTNRELLYNNLQKKISASDYDLILSYTNYNFYHLINNKLTKPSKKLRDCLYRYLDNYIFDLLGSKGFDLSLYKILFTNFKIKNSKKLLLKFDAEQIGPEHSKSWQISNFSFSTTNN